MEDLSSRTVTEQGSGVRDQGSGKWLRLRWPISYLLLVALLGPGCTTTSPFLSLGDLEKPARVFTPGLLSKSRRKPRCD